MLRANDKQLLLSGWNEEKLHGLFNVIERTWDRSITPATPATPGLVIRFGFGLDVSLASLS